MSTKKKKTDASHPIWSADGYEEGAGDEHGDFDGALKVQDFLPPNPRMLRDREETIPVTIRFHKGSLRQIREYASREQIPYQRLVRELTDWYATTLPRGSSAIPPEVGK